MYGARLNCHYAVVKFGCVFKIPLEACECFMSGSEQIAVRKAKDALPSNTVGELIFNILMFALGFGGIDLGTCHSVAPDDVACVINIPFVSLPVP